MTDITELARRVEHIISDMKLKHGDKDTYAPVMKWDEFLVLVEALEKAQQRIAELENYAEAEAVGADRAAEDSVYWMKRCKELESRAVTVKLPEPPGPMSIGARTVYFGIVADVVRSFQDGLGAAGIKVEAE